MTYQNGKIYKILNTVDDEVYVGSTCCSLSQRMAKHRWSAKQTNLNHRKLYLKINELGIDNFYIELIENFPCENKEQLDAREQHYMRQIGTLNMFIPGRSGKQWREEHKEHRQTIQKEYYDRNRELLKEKTRQWSASNKERKKQTDKEYAQTHKEEIRQYNQQYRKTHKEELSQYRKANKDAIAAKQKEYREAHKEAIAARQKEYREANKEAINEKRRQQYRERKMKQNPNEHD